MNINMIDKYHQMHKDVLELCAAEGIKIMPGRRPSAELLQGTVTNGLKDFLLLPEDMQRFSDLCADKLRSKGYVIQKGKAKKGDIYRVYSEDMLATSVIRLMNDLDGRHSPQFIMRQLTEAEDSYSFTANGKTFSFRKDEKDELVKTEYMGSIVYAKRDIKEYIEMIYGSDATSKVIEQGYGLFSADCSSEEFIEEAKSRGYLTDERISRFKEYREWKKENRDPIEEKYQEYQSKLLGLKQP